MVSTGKILKKEGMLLAQSNVPCEWKDKYTSLVTEFLKNHSLFTNEDVREYMASKGLGSPHHGGVWGAMFNGHFAKHDMVIHTGKVVKARISGSHERPLALWKSLISTSPEELLTLNQRLVDVSGKVKMRKLDLREALKLAAQYGAESVY